jgi:tRNA nucleotidyltransferase/poly(A) polymerase
MTPRQWAVEIVKQLQREGFQTFWAGGCVRDALLNMMPKDYDVATSATPDEVQQLFGLKKTLAIGKSFGVITVLGPKSAGHIEVATFRRDGGYSDGRRPDSVEFTDAKEDALRRDYTINGMFFDPITEKVIDYVGGEEDIQRKLIRAIGDAGQRIEEDKLRMLRGVRFAATYGFEIEPKTISAIKNKASEIGAVSPERIGAELRRMLGHAGKARALRLLIQSRLWEQVLPSGIANEFDFGKKVELLVQLDAEFPASLAAILSGTGLTASALQDSWRLKNDEVVRVDWILANEEKLARAIDLPWSQLQPLLISPHASKAIDVLQAKLDSNSDAAPQGLANSIALCRKKLSVDEATLNPAPLLRGDDLKALGISPGPQFKSILDAVRNKQLDGELNSADQARNWIIDSKE